MVSNLPSSIFVFTFYKNMGWSHIGHLDTIHQKQVASMNRGYFSRSLCEQKLIWILHAFNWSHLDQAGESIWK